MSRLKKLALKLAVKAILVLLILQDLYGWARGWDSVSEVCWRLWKEEKRKAKEEKRKAMKVCLKWDE